MTDRAKRITALVLLAAAALCVVVAVVLWQHANDDAESQAITRDYERAFGLSADDADADHTPSIVLLVVAGVGAVCGVILLATASAPEPSERRDRTDDSSAGWGA